MVVEKRLSMKNITGDRDKVCGFCLRGAVFSRDNKTLLVARMGGGGIAGFDVQSGAYLGTVMNVPSTPRHLVIQREDLLVSSNVSGTLARFSLSEIVSALRAAKGKRVQGPRPEVLKVGQGARTLEVSPDGHYAFVATNTDKSIAVVDLASFKKIKSLPASPFPVGLAISPNGCFLVSTSQGKPGRGGGNTVDVWSKC